uniref:prephenate dehydratase n=2 Tax=root TaxID=1 RepID=B3TCV3_9BACT|nr:putative Prephenate dehydratase [uncultured marine microorganism HF4000_005D21]ABZ10412.1 putative Prephenate dehydratase [uncultured marine bacterium HF4000_APKG3108]
MSDRIALQGEQGCFSHLASLEIFPNAEIKFCSTFEKTFQLAKENPKYKIVIPIENSLAGRVADIHYLIPKYKLQVHAEHFHKVNHNLLGIKGSKIQDIETVRSHSQAIGQCQKIIADNNLKPIISADTAGSARFIFEKKDKSEAAIASALAAKIYNLEILKSNIEDESGNVTRFFIMGNETNQPELKDKKYITSCIFQVKSIPAALYKALGGFATNGVNLCKLESFSVKNTFDQVNFYIDIEGHIEDPSLQKALEELGFHTQKLDILGVYEAHQFRLKN